MAKIEIYMTVVAISAALSAVAIVAMAIDSHKSQKRIDEMVKEKGNTKKSADNSPRQQNR